MAQKGSKRLVIDASVARAAGLKSAEAPESINCRDFLSETLKICHRLVMSPELRKEWEKHESRFARKWRKTMKARKKIVPLARPSNPELRQSIESAAPDSRARKTMLKDLHLIEAALSSDKIVISLDEEVRGLFTRVARQAPKLGGVSWRNPALEGETVLEWLRQIAGK